jgi:hypothetical protein
LSLYGTPIAPCPLQASGNVIPPSCFTNGQYNGNTGTDAYFGSSAGGSYVLGSAGLLAQSSISDRDSVVNLHFGFPHKNGTKDDIQLLVDVDHLGTQYYDSTNDQGGAAYLNSIGFGQSFYFDGYQYNGAVGALLPKGYTGGGVVQYFYPNSGNRNYSSADDPAYIPVDARDGISNDQNIFKLQYTHAIGENALLKVYGYTYYSDWLQQGPQSTYADFIGEVSPEYLLDSHTRGVSASFTDQLGSKNLLTLQGSYTDATTLRDNNTQFLNGPLYSGDAVSGRSARRFEQPV